MKSKVLSRHNLLIGAVGSMAIATLGESLAANAATPEHPNVAVVQRYYQAYGAGNIELIRKEIFAPEITWTIPGHHPLAEQNKVLTKCLLFSSSSIKPSNNFN